MPIFNSNFHDIMVVLDDFVDLCNLHSRKIANITGLLETQIIILKEVGFSPHVSHTKLTRKLNLSQYKVKKLIESLIKKKLIERTKNDEDKRVWSLQLTEEGTNILNTANLLREKLIGKFIKLPDWNQVQILATLQHLSEIIE